MRYYLSGKVTDNPNYMSEFAFVEEKIKDKFKDPEIVNPAKILESVNEVLTYDECMDICFKLVSMSDVVVMIDGWEKSKGACMEYGYAMAKGKAIIGSGTISK